MYTPGKGAVLAAATVAPIAATQLPQTGINELNEIALITAISLAVWALVYLKFRRTN